MNMPNWCNNSIKLTHDDPAMIAKAAQALADGKFLETFIPIPEELKGTTSPTIDSNPTVIYNGLEYRDWYSFCVNEWGTKWDVESYGATISQDGLTLQDGFDSAWSPPIKAYERLKELGFTVEALYYEPGLSFCGEFSDGFDQYYEIPSSADEVDAEIPEHINEAFAIGENMRMWEEEQEEFDAEPLAESFDPIDEENLEIDLDGGLSAINE